MMTKYFTPIVGYEGFAVEGSEDIYKVKKILKIN